MSAQEETPRIGVYVCQCGGNISDVVDVDKVVEAAGKLPGVVVAETNVFMCSDPGQTMIKEAIREHQLTGVVVAACSPRMHEPTFRNAVAEAGLMQMVDGAAQLDENLSIVPAPGHTPGTIVINFESQGEKALFCGDVLHHALQVYRPEWNSFACAEPVGARKSRREALEHCAGSGALLMPCHFGAPFTCHIDHKGSGFVPRFSGQF